MMDPMMSNVDSPSPTRWTWVWTWVVRVLDASVIETSEGTCVGSI